MFLCIPLSNLHADGDQEVVRKLLSVLGDSSNMMMLTICSKVRGAECKPFIYMASWLLCSQATTL